MRSAIIWQSYESRRAGQAEMLEVLPSSHAAEVRTSSAISRRTAKNITNKISRTSADADNSLICYAPTPSTSVSNKFNLRVQRVEYV
jgi:hypothetical protein